MEATEREYAKTQDVVLMKPNRSPVVAGLQDARSERVKLEPELSGRFYLPFPGEARS